MRRRYIIPLVGIWILAVAFGLHALMVYKGTPGAQGQVPESFPRNDLVALSANKPLLVMFAHPRCPCTKASLGELDQLLAKAKDQFEPVVLFYEPKQDSEAWSKGSLIAKAQTMPGVHVILDKDGSVAKRFEVETSGHTVVYSPQGKLLFSGGITGSRGHLGDNAGFDDVLRIVNNTSVSSSPQKTEVFGCGLFDRCTISEIAKKK